MKKGFILMECLIAAVFTALFVPFATRRFGERMRAAQELRAIVEAREFAASCLEKAAALYGAGMAEQFKDRYVCGCGVFDASVVFAVGAAGLEATAEVSWFSSAGEQKFRLERPIF